MRANFYILLATLALIGFAACSSDPPATDDDNGATSSSSSVGVGGGASGNVGADLQVTAARRVLEMDNGLRPGEGKTLFHVRVDLTNESSPEPLIASANFFQVRTGQSTLVLGSPLTATLADGCDGMTSLEQGGTINCRVTFELDNGVVPTAVVYDNLLGASAEARIDSFEPDVCTQTRGFPEYYDDTCEACRVAECSQFHGIWAVGGSCSGNQCFLDCRGPNTGDACTCFSQCGVSRECIDAWDDLIVCVVEKCSSECDISF